MNKPTPSRRQVLVAAGAAGAAIGISRLVDLPHPAYTLRAATRSGWPAPAELERARMAQLLRRAGFAVTPAALEAGLRDGFAGTVERLLETRPAEPPVLLAPGAAAPEEFVPEEDLRRWWIRHLLTSPTPFGERMTLFWHGHFTSDLDKSGALFMHWQNLSWRRMALRPLPDVLRQVTLDPAMLIYLDLGDSDASDPDVLPNENYARELLELFTMGPGRFSEGDVKAGARALAGWGPPAPTGQVIRSIDAAAGTTETVDVWSGPAPGQFDPSRAFPGELAFLGRRGRLGLNEVIEQVVAQPATAAFLARRVATTFISASPAPETVQALAEEFRRSRFELKSLLRAAFLSPEFSSPASFRSLVKSPIDLMVSAASALGTPPEVAAEIVASYGESTGQQLFSPPNVAGWPPNSRWISPGSVLARFNFVSELLEATPSPRSSAGAELLHLDGVLSEPTLSRLGAAGTETERWRVILAAPEFQLK